MNLLMKRSTRARNAGQIACHEECDPSMTPRAVKRMRRKFKRSERQKWKKEV